MKAKRKKVKQPKRVNPVKVWVGFVDGKPDWLYDATGRGKVWAVYKDRASARGMFSDVRKMTLEMRYA